MEENEQLPGNQHFGHSSVQAGTVLDSSNESTIAEKLKAKAFHVNRTLIPAANLDDQAADELQNLGLDVFNQEDFEEGMYRINDYLS